MSSGFVNALSALITPAQQVSFTIVIAGQNLTESVAQSLIEMTYTDTFVDKTMGDTLVIKIADPEGLFRQQFKFTASQEVLVTLTIQGWGAPYNQTLTKTLGAMWVVKVHMNGSASGGTVITLTCSSIPPQSPIKLQRKSAMYPATTGTTTSLKALATQICKADGITGGLVMTAPDFSISGVSQHDHSDMYLLHRICAQKDYYIKVVNNTLYIISAATVDTLAPIFQIYCPSPGNPGGYMNSGMEDWEFKEETLDTNYSSCQVSVLDPTTGQTVIGTATDPKGTGPVLIDHNQPVLPETESQDDINQDN